MRSNNSFLVIGDIRDDKLLGSFTINIENLMIITEINKAITSSSQGLRENEAFTLSTKSLIDFAHFSKSKVFSENYTVVICLNIV